MAHLEKPRNAKLPEKARNASRRKRKNAKRPPKPGNAKRKLFRKLWADREPSRFAAPTPRRTAFSPTTPEKKDDATAASTARPVRIFFERLRLSAALW